MSPAVKITRTDHTPEQLRGLAAKITDSAQTRRMLAIAMVLEGASRADAARQAGMDRQTLRDWVHRYNEAGVDGLVSRTAPGAKPKLTNAQMAELGALVVADPDPDIHKVVRWRCVDLRGRGGPAVRGYLGRRHHRQMAAPAGPDPAATAPVPSQEGSSSAGGL